MFPGNSINMHADMIFSSQINALNAKHRDVNRQLHRQQLLEFLFSY